MTELYGIAAVTHQTLGLLDRRPMPISPATYLFDRMRRGRHEGYAMTSKRITSAMGCCKSWRTTGKRVQVMGISHFHYKDGKIVDEWRVYDELSLLVQVKLAQLSEAAREPIYFDEG